VDAVILQHQDDAPAGLVLDALRDRELGWNVVHLDRREPLPAADTVALAVCLGSDAAADDERPEWVLRERDWLRAADLAGVPVLGLCFGAQALAIALGGGVGRARRPERGWIRIGSRAPDLIPDGPWLEWHDDVIALPPDAELLAENASGPQAYRISRHLGLQFHPEVTAAIVAEWVAGSREADLDGERMLTDTAREIERAAAVARAMFEGFIDAALATPARQES
jgi:GMP synthase-like glutamine amidotransferase